MQRAAASEPKRNPFAPSSLSTSPHPVLNGHPAKRVKLSSPASRSPDPNATSPYSPYQSDGPSTPVTFDISKTTTEQTHVGNADETFWILKSSRGTWLPDAPRSPTQDTSAEAPMIGRRTLGNFKKTTEKMAITGEGERDDSLSSEDLAEDYEPAAGHIHEATSPDGMDSWRKRWHIEQDNRMDKINLKRVKSGGISASSNRRNARSDAKKPTKDRQKC